MEKEVTLVTAFFDIGRKDFKVIPRSNEQYFSYFKVWAKMKNKLIVYTNSVMAQKVKEEREKWGLLDKTIVIEINDETSIVPDIFKKMTEISRNPYFLNYRLKSNAMSNNAHYDYVMLLKYWCLADAVKNGYADGMLAWIDFGFNHGDSCYINPDEFNFCWKTKLEEKIHLFTLGDITQKPIFHLVRTLEDSIMGCIIILPSSLCEKFWNLIKQSTEALIDVGFIDDDQLMVLMAYRKEKDVFRIHESDWFLPLKENGAEHLTVKEKNEQNKNIVRKLREKINLSKRKEINSYLKRTKKEIGN